MMKNYMSVEFSDGSIFRIPIGIIALARADYFAKKEGEDDPVKYSTIYEEEYQYTLSSDAELLDWAANNMNWSDVEEYAIQVDQKDIDFEKEWPNTVKAVVKRN